MTTKANTGEFCGPMEMLNVLIAVMVTHICTDLRAVHQKSKTNCKHTYHILIMVVVAWVYIYLSKFNGQDQKKKKKIQWTGTSLVVQLLRL